MIVEPLALIKNLKIKMFFKDQLIFNSDKVDITMGKQIDVPKLND